MSRPSSQYPATVIAVEKNHDDQLLLQRAFAEISFPAALLFARDGEQLISMLAATPKEKFPSLVLIGLNLPEKGGGEALRAIKGHREFKNIPVLVLSNSKDPGVMSACYADGVNSYFSKPDDYPGYLKVLATIKNYWLGWMEMPWSG